MMLSKSNEIRSEGKPLPEEEYVDVDSINQPIRWSPSTGESEIAGVLEKIEMLENHGKPFPVYFIRSLDGVVYSISGYTVLRQKMDGVTEGTRIKIAYLGTSEKSGALMFKVSVHACDVKNLSVG